jgi:hypothetical protein
MAKKSGRGSSKISGAAAKRAKALQSAIAGWKVIDWHELGKPAPEIITGGLAGRPSKLRDVVSKLSKLKEVRDINILINGTPRPDIANVRFTMRAGGGR